MAWTAKEKNDLFLAYWNQGKADCPTCNAASIRFNYRQHLSGYLLAARCPRGCGNCSMLHTEDPEIATFREWTPEEEELIFERHFADKPITCPVDGTRVGVQERPNSHGNLFTARCPRCWKGVQKNFAKASV